MNTTTIAGSVARTLLLALLIGVGSALELHAEETTPGDGVGALERVEVLVTAVSGGQIYLDKGRDDHIEPGDTVELWPVGGPTVLGVVRAVSRSSSRAELSDGDSVVRVGDRGEVLVPETRLAPPPEEPADAPPVPDRDTPEHPPWSEPMDGWDPAQPLLAPAFSRPAEEQPAILHGRFFTQFNGTWDHEHGNQYELWRTGIDARVDNPFGRGGQFRLDVDVFHRASHLELGADDATTRWRLDRASYRWGGNREDPDRYEVGRFLQHEFPELGVLDGVEWSHRTDRGDRFGASFGFMPETSPVRETGADVQAAVFYRTDSDGEDPVEYGVAWQNTWHHGEADRNLLVGTVEVTPSEDVRITGEALVDHYGAGDSVKDAGFELTEARVNARWRLDDDTGVGAHASLVRWPEIKRQEFGDLTATQLLDNRVTRVGVDGWRDLTEHLRLDARLDRWTDQDDAGGSGSLRAALRDVAWERGQLAAEVFFSQGSFTDGAGLRLSAQRVFESLGYGTLSWETSRYTSDTEFGGSVDTNSQAVRASLDTDLGDGWSLSAYGERRMGDGQDSDSIGLFLQERF